MFVDDHRMRRQPLSHQTWRDITPRVTSAQVEEWPPLVRVQNHRDQRFGISFCRLCRKPRLSRHCRRSVAHADCFQWQRLSDQAQSYRGLYPCLTRQDQHLMLSFRPDRFQKAQLHDGRNDHVQSITEPVGQGIGEPLGLRQGPGQ